MPGCTAAILVLTVLRCDWTAFTQARRESNASDTSQLFGDGFSDSDTSPSASRRRSQGVPPLSLGRPTSSSRRGSNRSVQSLRGRRVDGDGDTITGAMPSARGRNAALVTLDEHHNHRGSRNSLGRAAPIKVGRKSRPSSRNAPSHRRRATKRASGRKSRGSRFPGKDVDHRRNNRSRSISSERTHSSMNVVVSDDASGGLPVGSLPAPAKVPSPLGVKHDPATTSPAVFAKQLSTGLLEELAHTPGGSSMQSSPGFLPAALNDSSASLSTSLRLNRGQEQPNRARYAGMSPRTAGNTAVAAAQAAVDQALAKAGQRKSVSMVDADALGLSPSGSMGTGSGVDSPAGSARRLSAVPAKLAPLTGSPAGRAALQSVGSPVSAVGEEPRPRLGKRPLGAGLKPRPGLQPGVSVTGGGLKTFGSRRTLKTPTRNASRNSALRRKRTSSMKNMVANGRPNGRLPTHAVDPSEPVQDRRSSRKQMHGARRTPKHAPRASNRSLTGAASIGTLRPTGSLTGLHAVDTASPKGRISAPLFRTQEEKTYANSPNSRLAQARAVAVSARRMDRTGSGASAHSAPRVVEPAGVVGHRKTSFARPQQQQKQLHHAESFAEALRTTFNNSFKVGIAAALWVEVATASVIACGCQMPSEADGLMRVDSFRSTHSGIHRADSLR